MPRTVRRDKRLQVAVSATEERTLKLTAQKAGVPFSIWARLALLAAAAEQEGK